MLDERSQETEAALTIVRRVTSSLDLAVVLRESLALATAVARCQVGAIYLLDEDQKRLWIRATSPGYEQLIDNYSLEVGAGLTGWSALNRMPAVISGQPHDDPRYAPVPAVDLDFNSALTYPMVICVMAVATIIILSVFVLPSELLGPVQREVEMAPAVVQLPGLA